MTSLIDIAHRIRAGEVSAVQIVQQTLQTIRERNSVYNAVTRLLDERALKAAAEVDARLARGEQVGPLAGVPFGVKDLFDLEGLVTTAGSVVLKNQPSAKQDAEVVRRLCAAGAIPVATLNMDEFAYGFATENAHYGTTKNPHDTARLAGGSSGGSTAAVAAGLLPLTLGSDTNGSIRVPASLCGVWGLRPTQGLLPLQGVYPFAASLDVVGPFTSTSADLACAFEALSGQSVATDQDVSGLKIGRLDGWFAQDLAPELVAGMDRLLDACADVRTVTLPEVARARAASFVITAAEGGALHLGRLRTQAMAYDPATRDRLMAGALLPAIPIVHAQRIRSWFRDVLHDTFREVDILVAPATTGVAPRLDQPTIMLGGKQVSARANLGLFTQPLSLAGMPVVAAPLAPAPGKPDGLPLGVQLIAAPGKEATLLAFAQVMEKAGLLGFPCADAPLTEQA
ncbi:AtzE family amidohydrolase [Acetobacter cerevisiae]|uniref:AtzE family amidohydrolase n=1 Tax=Acetobacter cerevisiae TaxID=178900 RepID=A0ABT1EX99_9PROT|nr:AtzE family amidohydrolase [Acetobacter cerevisiae]MCP1246580.1 AtzE family amidohydrolase [Acetobacter cerevisiae]MCP1256103.1 AtzE family amidohydrolase [Acetobacter cerevisiae]